MGNTVSTRALLLVNAVTASSLTGVVASWITSEIEQSIGKALLAGGAAFGGTLALLIVTFNFLARGDA